MPRESDLTKRIRARITDKRAQLPNIDANITSQRAALVELTLTRSDIVAGIEEDEELLRNAEPKMPRTRKARSIRADEKGVSERRE